MLEARDFSRVRLHQKSTEIVRLARSSGRSCRLQALTEDSSIQMNVGDLCVLVYRDPERVEVVPTPRRKTRSDAARIETLFIRGAWSLGRYITIDK